MTTSPENRNEQCHILCFVNRLEKSLQAMEDLVKSFYVGWENKDKFPVVERSENCNNVVSILKKEKKNNSNLRFYYCFGLLSETWTLITRSPSISHIVVFSKDFFWAGEQTQTFPKSRRRLESSKSPENTDSYSTVLYM